MGIALLTVGILGLAAAAIWIAIDAAKRGEPTEEIVGLVLGCLICWPLCVGGYLIQRQRPVPSS